MQDPTNMVAYCALASLYIVDTNKRNETLDALLALQAETLKEAGCRQFDFFETPGDPSRILLLEAFVNREAFEQHLRQVHTRRYFALGLTELRETTLLSPIAPITGNLSAQA